MCNVLTTHRTPTLNLRDRRAPEACPQESYLPGSQALLLLHGMLSHFSQDLSAFLFFFL